VCKQVLASDQTALDALKLIGICTCLSGQSTIAVAVLELVRACSGANDAGVLGALSVAHEASGNKTAALTFAQQAIALAPESPQHQRALAKAYSANGNYAQAAATLEKLVEAGKAQPKDRYLLGVTYRKLKQYAAAIEILNDLSDSDPENVTYLTALGQACEDAGRGRDAVKAYTKALQLDPENEALSLALGTLFYRGGNLTRSLAVLRAGYKNAPKNAGILVNLGLTLAAAGMPRAAVDAFGKSYQISHSPVAHSNAVFYVQYLSGEPSVKIHDMHHKWFLRHGARLVPLTSRFPEQTDPNKRLRIGYVSPDFRAHSCAYFLRGLLSCHRHDDFEIYAYMTEPTRDKMAEKFKSAIDVWRDADGLSPSRLAEMIRTDAIDILVDLAGHTARNSLLTFAMKPAPVQATWLGYPTTTGLETIDWRISDPWLTPEPTPEGFSERLYRLPRVSHSYTPGMGLHDIPPVEPSPFQANGHLTFGSFNNLAKISDDCLAFWAAVLNSVSDARLRIKSRHIGDAEVQNHLTKRYAAAGGDVSRLDIVGGTEKKEDHLSQIGDVDIALDTYPYGGMTTTCETVMMGVPVLSLVGERSASRYGLSVLTAVGLPEFASPSVDDLVALAKALNEDRDRLRQLRAGLRDQVLASPLCDHADFARAMETAYRDMWTQWCASQTTQQR